MPSPLPVNPMCSSVLALTLTAPTGSASTSAILRAHRADMRCELRRLANHRAVNVSDFVARRANQVPDRAKKFRAVRAAVRRIAVRKMRADIAERRRAEQRIRNRM